jgi:hypothetical protein
MHGLEAFVPVLLLVSVIYGLFRVRDLAEETTRLREAVLELADASMITANDPSLKAYIIAVLDGKVSDAE